MFGGFVAALISAAVALLVLLVTVRAQNRGIREQLAVQERSVAEQLSVQRHENARTREVATVGRMLTILSGWEHARAREDITFSERHVSLTTALNDLDVGLEELRINGDAAVDTAIDRFKTFVHWMYQASGDYIDDDRYRFSNPGNVAFCLERFLTHHLVRYARMDRSERVELGAFLTTASSDLEPHDTEAWEAKYMYVVFNRPSE